MNGLGRRTLGSFALGLGGLLAGCASPEPEYYRLTPVPGAPRPWGNGSVKLRRVGVPGYLDRPEIVRAGAGGRLDVMGGARWAEPLEEMLSRVLAENLRQRLPGRTVFGESSAVSVDADAVLEVEVQRLEAVPGGSVDLTAQAGLRVGRGGTHSAPCATSRSPSRSAARARPRW